MEQVDDGDDHGRLVTVSCIMIFLDEDRYLDEAIRSVVEQHFEDWELLLVDDGSTDRSTQIARRWSALDTRIRYLEHPGHANRGMSASRNLGVRHSRGAIIGFLDGDDVWLAGALSHVVRRFERHPEADALYCQTWFWNSWRADQESYHSDYVQRCTPTLERGVVLAPPTVYNATYRAWPWGMPAICAVFLRRAGLEQIGGSVDTFRGMYEDHVLYAKIGLHLRVLIDDRVVALYRKRPDSVSVVDPPGVQSEFLAWLNRYIEAAFESENGTSARAIAEAEPRPRPSPATTRDLARSTAIRAWRTLAPTRLRRAIRERRHVAVNTRVLQHLGAVKVRAEDDIVAVWLRQFLGWWRHDLGGSVLVRTDSLPTDRIREDVVDILGHSLVTVTALDTPPTGPHDHVVIIAPSTCVGAAAVFLSDATDNVTDAGTCIALFAAPGSPLAVHDDHDDQHVSTAGWHGVEDFGSAKTSRAIQAGSQVRDLSGADIDRHEGAHSLLVGLAFTVTTRSTETHVPVV